MVEVMILAEEAREIGGQKGQHFPAWGAASGRRDKLAIFAEIAQAKLSDVL
jgi:hypothetical protein